MWRSRVFFFCVLSAIIGACKLFNPPHWITDINIPLFHKVYPGYDIPENSAFLKLASDSTIEVYIYQKLDTTKLDEFPRPSLNEDVYTFSLQEFAISVDSVVYKAGFEDITGISVPSGGGNVLVPSLRQVVIDSFEIDSIQWICFSGRLHTTVSNGTGIDFDTIIVHYEGLPRVVFLNVTGYSTNSQNVNVSHTKLVSPLPCSLIFRKASPQTVYATSADSVGFTLVFDSIVLDSACIKNPSLNLTVSCTILNFKSDTLTVQRVRFDTMSFAIIFGNYTLLAMRGIASIANVVDTWDFAPNEEAIQRINLSHTALTDTDLFELEVVSAHNDYVTIHGEDSVTILITPDTVSFDTIEGQLNLPIELPGPDVTIPIDIPTRIKQLGNKIKFATTYIRQYVDNEFGLTSITESRIVGIGILGDIVADTFTDTLWANSVNVDTHEVTKIIELLPDKIIYGASLVIPPQNFIWAKSSYITGNILIQTPLKLFVNDTIKLNLDTTGVNLPKEVRENVGIIDSGYIKIAVNNHYPVHARLDLILQYTSGGKIYKLDKSAELPPPVIEDMVVTKPGVDTIAIPFNKSEVLCLLSPSMQIFSTLYIFPNPDTVCVRAFDYIDISTYLVLKYRM